MQTYRLRPLLTLVAAVAIVFVVPWSASGQAVECFRATTAVETAICSDPSLTALDAKMARLYADFVNVSTPESRIDWATQQTQWMTTTREACANELYVKSCLSAAYNARNAFLFGYARWQLGPASSRTIMYFCEDKTILTVDYRPKGGTNDRVTQGKARVTYGS